MNRPLTSKGLENFHRPLRVAVIGAGGFVGSRLIAMGRLDTRYSMVPVLRSFRGLARLGADGEEGIVVNTRDSTALAEAIKKCDVVINATSGEVLKIENDMKAIYAACCQAGVKRLIHISSTVVYGGAEDPTINDDSPPNTRSWMLYARNKARAEVWLRAHMSQVGLQVVILRPGLIWGPGSSWSCMVGAQLWQGNAFLSNNGQGIANLVYIDNLVRMILAVAAKPSGPSGFYNVADRETVTWAEWYRAMAKRLGYDDSVVRLSPSHRLRPSFGLVVEWLSQRGLLLQFAKRMPKPIADFIKRILGKKMPNRSVPFHHLIGSSETPLRLSRTIRDVQNTVYRLPANKIFVAFGPIERIAFDLAATATAAWLRYAGFSPPPESTCSGREAISPVAFGE